MASDSWQRVADLFDRAVELDGPEREDFLRRECGDDEILLKKVRELIAADEDPDDGFLKTPVLASQGDISVRPRVSPGDRLGPFRLVREIGRGGMGVVFLATRDDQTFEREVAIKLLNSRLASPEAHRRLEIERQMLAGLDHPSIATLFDGGTADDGSPYLVMEHIDGPAIDTYCDQERLTVEQRIELFLKVCEAVQVAHRSLVVHRDLKPSNILMTREGVPKLLDFGIAKWLEPQSSGATSPVTEAWMRVLTPGYASPEQVQGRPVTTACDVYALGVLLYKLLSGTLPFRFNDSSLEDIDRVLRSREAPKASEGLRRGADDPDIQSLAAERRLSVKGLAARLSGDLDAILAKALRSSPEHRYGTVDQLAEDLRRALNGFPVRARRGTWRYRAKKLFARHRRSLSALAAVAVAGVVALIGLTRLSIQLQQERDDKDQVISFIVDLFETADPASNLGEALTVRQVLDQTEGRFDALSDQPEVESTLREVVGRIYLSLGVGDRATEAFAAALRLQERLHGDDSPEASQLRSRYAVALRESGDFDSAIETGRRAVEDLRRAGVPGEELVPPLNDWVSSLCILGRYEAADPPSEEALDLSRRAVGERCDGTSMEANQRSEETCLDLARSQVNRGAVLRFQEKIEEAADLYGRALVIYQRLLPSGHPEIADLLSVRAALLRQLGRLEEAEAAYREVLAAQRQVYGDDHPHMARTLGLLASLLFETGRDEEALEENLRSVEMLHRTWGAEHPRTLWSEILLARRFLERGRPERAETRLRSHLATWRAADLGGQCWLAAEVEGTLGEALMALGRFDQAAPLVESSFHTVFRELGHQESPKSMGRVQRALDRWESFRASADASSEPST